MSSKKPLWSVEDVGDVGIGYHDMGVVIMNVCCHNRSLTVTAGEAREFAAALIAAADYSDSLNQVSATDDITSSVNDE